MIFLSLTFLYPQVLNKQRITELVREVDPNEQLEEEVEEMLLAIADDFIESTVNAACRLAKHRGARSLDVKDVQMYLGKVMYCIMFTVQFCAKLHMLMSFYVYSISVVMLHLLSLYCKFANSVYRWWYE